MYSGPERSNTRSEKTQEMQKAERRKTEFKKEANNKRKKLRNGSDLGDDSPPLSIPFSYKLIYFY